MIVKAQDADITLYCIFACCQLVNIIIYNKCCKPPIFVSLRVNYMYDFFWPLQIVLLHTVRVTPFQPGYGKC